MSEVFTKGMARNIYFGGSIFFVLVFLGLTFHTTRTLPKTDNRANLTEQVAFGKTVWEENNCIGCHTLLGEGAYFAPSLEMFTNVLVNPEKPSRHLFNTDRQKAYPVAEACPNSTSVKRNWMP